MTVTTVKKTSGKKAPPKNADEVLYPKIEVETLLGDNALTADKAKELLGWMDEREGGPKFGDDYLLVDEAGKKVRCTNDTHNRPFSEPWARTLAQDILNHNWADSRNGEGRTVNGETIVVGKYGQVLSGQHRGIALILAQQLLEGKQANHWKPLWPTGVVSIEAIVVYGVDESGVTTRTLDNVKPRSLADVLFCDPAMFGKAGKGDRVALTKMTQHCVSMLWDRTGAKEDAFSPRCTHSEAMDFIERHPRIVRAVKHIYQENADNSLSAYLSPGYAAAMLYLMGSSATDGDLYHNMNTPSEKKINWDLWDKACDFWVVLGKAGGELHELRNAYASYINVDTGDGKPSLKEKLALLIKAWDLFRNDEKVTGKGIQLRYEVDGDGIRQLMEQSTLGGIERLKEEDKDATSASTTKGLDDGDTGLHGQYGEDDQGDGPLANDPSPEEIGAAKASTRQANGHTPGETIKPPKKVKVIVRK